VQITMRMHGASVKVQGVEVGVVRNGMKYAGAVITACNANSYRCSTNQYP
jgi:hypothetical protein